MPRITPRICHTALAVSALLAAYPRFASAVDNDLLIGAGMSVTLNGSATYDQIDNDGTLTVGLPNLSTATIAGPITNRGTILEEPYATLVLTGPIDNASGSIQVAGTPLVGTLPTQLTLTGMVTGGSLSGTNTRVQINGGGIVDAAIQLNAASVLTLSSGTINVTAPITLNIGSGPEGEPFAPGLVFNSTVPNSQSVGAIIQIGTTPTHGIPNDDGVTIGPGSTLVCDQLLTAFTVQAGGLVIIRPHGANSPASWFVPGALTGSQASINIDDNKLIVNGTLPKATAAAQLANELVIGRHGGDWLGMGITSTTVAADNSATGSHSTTLALYDNADLGLSTFGGQTVNSSALLVSIALVGDSNLDGKIDGADFNNWYAHRLQSSPFASQGDFNLDGVVNGLDFQIWFNAAGPTAQPTIDALGLSYATLAATGGVPVPEPASAALALTVAPWLLTRRRRPKPTRR